MKPTELYYKNLQKRLEKEPNDGKSTHKKFLRWFLIYVIGLDEISADDTICDGVDDKGIDGILVNHDDEEVMFIQSKVKEKSTAKIGDKFIREFHGSYSHLKTATDIEKLLKTKPNEALTKIINQQNIIELIKKGYLITSCFITNNQLDEKGADQVGMYPEMRCFDREKICEMYLGSDETYGVPGNFTFDYENPPLEYSASSNVDQIVLMAKASDLVKLPGIESNKLFDLNVRYPLGNTKVNKGIKKSIADKKEHRLFPLFHNGLVIVCNDVEIDEGSQQVKVKDIAVVNGAQSLKQLHLSNQLISSDLKVLTRIINAGLTSDLASKVTDRTNTQNGVRSRDKKSNDLTQRALKTQISDLNLGYSYEIKRGSGLPEPLITNERAGQLLLTFDLQEAHSTHQLASIFESRYADIFNRPIVNGSRIVGVYDLYCQVEIACSQMDNKALGSYAQTKYLLLQTLREIFEQEDCDLQIYKDLGALVEAGKSKGLKKVAKKILKDLIIDLEEMDDSVADLANFKSDLKNRKICAKIILYLRKERKRLVKTKRSPSLQKLINKHLFDN